MADTHIEWTDRVWNPTTGCDRVSPGCDHCYALTMAKRLKGMGQPKYQNDGDARTSGPGFLATEHESELDAPLRWRKPAKVFVNSMSDLFHDAISDEFIVEVFGVMALARRHTFQVLTKRHGRLRSLLCGDHFGIKVLGEMHRQKWASGIDAPPWQWPLPNVWLGVSVEDQQWADIRVPALLATPAAVRFLSCEPLLGPIDLLPFVAHQCDCEGDYHNRLSEYGSRVDWVIVGGESGPGARPMHPAWARQLRDPCTAAGVPFHFKQWGEWSPVMPRGFLVESARWRLERTRTFRPDGSLYRPTEPDTLLEPAMASTYRVGKKAAGRELDGRTWDEFPEPHRTEVPR